MGQQHQAQSVSAAMRANNVFWHPPMLPQAMEKSPTSFLVHPPMLPVSPTSAVDEYTSFGAGAGIGVGVGVGIGGGAGAGSSSGLGLAFGFGEYFHPPMVLGGSGVSGGMTSTTTTANTNTNTANSIGQDERDRELFASY